jgi:hypothetical protein
VKPDRTTSDDVHVLACAECPRVSSATARGWRAYRTDELEWDEPPALAFFCRDCSRKEFGEHERRGPVR